LAIPDLRPALRANKWIAADVPAQIREAVGIPPGRSAAALQRWDTELRHWLRECAYAYHAAALAYLPWRAAINAVHRRRGALLTARQLTLATVPDVTVRAELDRIIQATETYEDALRRDSTLRRKTIAPQCLLIGGHLPFVFRVMYSPDQRRGTGQVGEPASSRFIAECCKALGLPKPSSAAIRKHRDRYLSLPRPSSWPMAPREQVGERRRRTFAELRQIDRWHAQARQKPSSKNRQ
jgi:hypothetical protein